MKKKNNESNNRRNFLKTLALGTGASMLSGCLKKDLRYKKDIQIIENKYKLIAKLKCPFCNAGCLLNVRSEDSKVKSIGKISPVVQPKSTSGMICLKGMVIPETLFTKRLKKPLVDKIVFEKYKSWKSSGDKLNDDYNDISSDKQKLRNETLGYNSDKEAKRDFIEISINEAIELIGNKTINTLQKLTSDEIYSYSSTSLPIEAHYSINKFMRGLLSSPNIDSDIRLGGFSSILAMKDSIGSYLSNNRIEELLSTDLVFISGANIRSSMPVYFWKYLDAIRKQQKTTVIIDPRKTSTVREIENILLSDKEAKKKTFGYSSVVGSVDETNCGNLYHLSTINSDITIINTITHKILTKHQNAIDTNFVNNFTEGYEAFSKNIMDNYSFEKVKNIIGISEELINKIAQEIATTSINAKQRNEGGVLWLVGQGVSQNLYGYETVKSIINLLAITGNLSRKGAGLVPVVGQNNAMGCFASGNIGETLIGGISTEEALKDNRFSKWSFTMGYNNIPITEVISSMWGIDASSLEKVISKKPKMFAKSFTKGENKVGSTAYIIGSALKMIPSYNQYLKKNLSKSFSIVFDIYEDTHNKEFADIILPCSAFGEKNGSIIDLNRDLYLNQKTITNQNSLSEIEYINKISNHISKVLHNRDIETKEDEELRKDLFDELAKLSRGTEFELPIELIENTKSEEDYLIPFRYSTGEDPRFLFADKYDRRRFFRGYRTKSGKINLSVINQKVKDSSSEDSEIERIFRNVYEKANFDASNITNIPDKDIMKLKSNGLIIRYTNSDFRKNTIEETVSNNKYPFWLCVGSVYEHYHFGITEHSTILNEWLKEPYIEVNQYILDMFNLGVGEKAKIKTPNGEFIASLCVYNGKLRPGRNEVPDHIIFVPYSLLYLTGLNNDYKISALDSIIPLFDPVTGVFESKTPCRLEYL